MARESRVGVPTTRETTTETVVEQPTPFHAAADWAKTHPMQAAGSAALVLPLLMRLIKRMRGGGEKEKVASGGSAKAEESKSPLLKRATPRRHESTEEAMDLLGNTARKYIIVGGKGGVGKTSMSAAVATAFADRNQTTLIVSTDPAHSLSDAFGQSVSGGEPVPVLGIDNLYAQEVNPETMKRTFKMMQQQPGNMGGLDELGLDDLNSLFETLPPGFDEAVALVEIIKYIEGDEDYRRFDRIVFDTAPTGHTLRLLSLPDFLNGFFGKIISMKSKFGSVMGQFKGMFGGGANEPNLDASMDEMEELKRSMATVRDLFRDEYQTEFIVATIPNMMAISESTRLVEELHKEHIPVRHLFVNQVQPSNDGCAFCSARYKEHSANMQYIQQTFNNLQIATVQSFDREIKGVGALRTMGTQLFPPSSASGDATSSVRCDHSATAQNGVASRAGTGGGTTEIPKARAEVVE